MNQKKIKDRIWKIKKKEYDFSFSNFHSIYKCIFILLKKDLYLTKKKQIFSIRKKKKSFIHSRSPRNRQVKKKTRNTRWFNFAFFFNHSIYTHMFIYLNVVNSRQWKFADRQTLNLWKSIIFIAICLYMVFFCWLYSVHTHTHTHTFFFNIGLCDMNIKRKTNQEMENKWWIRKILTSSKYTI